jgi:hypothetical protein
LLRRPTAPIPPIKRPDGSWARSDSDKAQAFAHHLESVFTPLTTNPETNDEDITLPPDVQSPPAPLLKHFSPSEIWRQIKTIKPRKAPGHDLITGEVLNHITRKALAALTAIYNSMIRTNYFPLQWKLAHIILVPKPGKPTTEVTSYRPISLLTITSKIFERLLLTRVLSTHPLSSLIPHHQFGFRPGHSTIQQCHRLVRYIQQAIEDKKVCPAVFLDTHQAFDKVWHTGLIRKLTQKLPQQLSQLLQSYLLDRTFQVKINAAVSSISEVHSGVPQGSVLGPFLFLLYTADLPTTNDTVLATFADDTVVLSAHQNPQTATEHLQLHLNLLYKWYQNWRMLINKDKSVYITFTNRRTVCPTVTINAEEIPRKTATKYLGLHLDSKLTWRTHIQKKRQQIKIKAQQLHWLLGKHSQLSLQNKILLYKTIIKPIWTYGIALWGCARPSNTKILQSFQSKLLRTITTAPWYVTNRTIHDDLQIPFISEEIRQHASRHRLRTTGHENPLIAALLKAPPPDRRLLATWPEDLTS